MLDITFVPPLDTPLGIVILCSNSVVLSSIVLPTTATHVPSGYGGAANAFWATVSEVTIGWTYDGTNFTSPPSINSTTGLPYPTRTVLVSSLTRIIVAGT